MSIVDRWVAEEIRCRKENGEVIADEDALKEHLKKELLDPSNWEFEGPDELAREAKDLFTADGDSVNWWEEFNI